jgi:two-component system CheB/CheR fusion protein
MDPGNFQLLHLALHEMRTPLTSVQLNAQLIERSLVKLGLENECRLAGTIISAARKLDELTQELGDLARLRSGKIALDLRVHDLTRLLTEVVSRHVGVPDSHRVRLAVPGQPLPITVDARRLDRIVSNLILIGLRLDAGGTGIDLRVNASLAEVEIAVIAPGDVSDATSAPPSDDELGLGLFLARILVECHGGKLEVQRGPAREVVFRFSLPSAGRA